MDLQGAELEAMIQAEKKQVASEYHGEAWADGISDGIETDILAETAVATALTEFVRQHGEAGAQSFLDQLRDRLEQGEFRENRTLQ